MILDMGEIVQGKEADKYTGRQGKTVDYVNLREIRFRRVYGRVELKRRKMVDVVRP